MMKNAAEVENTENANQSSHSKNSINSTLKGNTELNNTVAVF